MSKRTASRRYSTHPLPAVRYIPGRGVHPSRRPAAEALPAFDDLCLTSENWSRCEAFLYGADLWNTDYLWEAHEVFEALFREPDAPESVRAVLQGLIQLAAALLQQRLDHPRGARRLADRARVHLAAAENGLLGFDASVLVDRVDAYMAGASEALPRLVLDAERCDREA